MKTRLVLFNGFSALDAILTLIAISMGFDYKLNPIMSSLLEQPFQFLQIKIFTGILLTLWIARKKDNYSNIASWFCVIATGLLCLWNLVVYVICFTAIF